MITIRFLTEAEDESNNAANHYNNKDIGLGYDFLDDLESSLDTIKSAPMRWKKIEGRIHRFIMKKFPYKIIYEISDTIIFILAVAHQSRKPDYWKN
jgi:mRNA-degrading endonuclease RelE of RelBE toxin-antitoxin system